MLLWIVKVAQSLTICRKPLALDNVSCYYLGVKQKFCKGGERLMESNLRDEFNGLKKYFGVSYADYCNEEETQQYAELAQEDKMLPVGIKESGDGRFYRETQSDMTDEEIRQCLLMKQTYYLKTIKFCAVFITVLVLIGIIASLIWGFQLASTFNELWMIF